MSPPPPAFGRAQFGLINIPDRFANWAGGSAQELAETANEVLAETEVPDAELNERLVRHYVTMGVLDPPVRKGREAIFGLRHLVQLMVVRKLLADRLSLSQVRDVFRTMNWNEVDAVAELLPKPAPATEAERLVAQFRDDVSPVQHLMKSKRQQWAAQRASSRDAAPLVRWKLNSWCEVLADPLAVENLTDEQAAQLGHELVAAITHFRNQRRHGGTK